jgi:hypothetical protein
VRFEALMAAGNAAADAVNAQGDSVVVRLEQIPPQVDEVALHGVRYGAAAAFAAVRAYTVVDMRGLDMTTSEVITAMEEESDEFAVEAAAIADATPAEFVVNNLFGNH